MCQKCILESLEEEGVDLSKECFLTPQAVTLMVLLHKVAADPESFGITEEVAELNTGKDLINPATGTMAMVIQNPWNACTKAERTMALGAVRYGMFIYPLARVALREIELDERKLN